MVKKLIRLCIFGWILSFGVSSCYYNKEEKLYPKNDCDTSSITWNGQIKALFASSCVTGCHDAATGFSGIVLDSYDKAKKAVEQGNLICNIEQLPGATCSPMPKGGAKWASCKITQVKVWKSRNYPQ